MTTLPQSDPASWIPHRAPILCIDVVAAVGTESVAAERSVRPADTVDGELPEPWLVEGLAQTAAVLNGKDQSARGRRTVKGMLVGVRRLIVHRRARAGERVRFRVELLRRIPPLTLMRGTVSVGDESIAEGELKFFVSEARIE